ncbi:hypothetical protein BJY01DRAFT_47169 [Aspergillus pseudoustus]|uniref:Uncharacterized protein n=1 Tax=Aspergillus pseudoustus TaxID=1810923 RepID=A0ABR4JDL1_9EURO
MGSGRLLGLAWHLHRSGSSSLSCFFGFPSSCCQLLSYPLLSTFLTPFSLLFDYIFSHFHFLSFSTSYLSVPLHTTFYISCPVGVPHAFSKFKYLALATTVALLVTPWPVPHSVLDLRACTIPTELKFLTLCWKKCRGIPLQDHQLGPPWNIPMRRRHDPHKEVSLLVQTVTYPIRYNLA